jgi:hypothetical protein
VDAEMEMDDMNGEEVDVDSVRFGSARANDEKESARVHATARATQKQSKNDMDMKSYDTRNYTRPRTPQPTRTPTTCAGHAPHQYVLYAQ